MQVNPRTLTISGAAFLCASAGMLSNVRDRRPAGAVETSQMIVGSETERVQSTGRIRPGQNVNAAAYQMQDARRCGCVRRTDRTDRALLSPVVVAFEIAGETMVVEAGSASRRMMHATKQSGTQPCARRCVGECWTLSIASTLTSFSR